MLDLNNQKIDWRLFLLPLFVLLVPIILFFGIQSEPPKQHQEIVHEKPNVRRIVIVIVDALRKSNIDEDMPRLKAFSENAHYLPLDTCLANFTLPCIQSLLEGNEGSPVSAIHNFTGKKSTSSLLSILARKNWTIETYSDHTLGALFQHLSDRSENLDSYTGNELDKDLKLIGNAQSSLEKNTNQHLLILHIPGTDKKVHGSPVGGEAYRKHFRAVDLAIQELLKTLDFENDFLFISGDHGHDDEGFHDRNSVAIMKAPTFFELDKMRTPRLSSLDLAFWLSFASNSYLIDGYQGRNFWLKANNLNSQKTAFQNQEEHKLRKKDFSGNTIEELLQSKRARGEQKALVSNTNTVSVLLLFLALLLTCLFPNHRWKGVDILIISVSIILSFSFFLTVQWQIWPLLFRAILLMVALFFLFYRKTKIGLLTSLLFILSLTSAFFDISINSHFRSGDGGDFLLTVYGSVTFLSVLSGLFYLPGVLVSEEKESAFDMQDKKNLADKRKKFRTFVLGMSILIGMLSLGSGHFFYNSSSNFFNVFFFVGTLILLALFSISCLENKKLPKIALPKSHILHVIIFLSVVVVLQLTDQFNWRWTFEPTGFLKTHVALSYIFIILCVLYFYWSAPGRKYPRGTKDKHAYYFLVLPFFVFTFFYTSWAGIELSGFAVSLIPSILLVSFFTLRGTTDRPYENGTKVGVTLVVTQESPIFTNDLGNHKGLPLQKSTKQQPPTDRPYENRFDEGFDAILLFASVYATTWLGVDGFDLGNIDFTFFDQYFPEYVSTLSTDAERFLFYAPLTFPKYLLTAVFPFLIFFLMRGIRLRVCFYVLGLFLIQIVFLVGDIVFSMSTKSVLVGFTVDDIVFVWLISLAITLFLIVAVTITKFRKSS